ncbi:GGDEF domain-containing protein [Thaumasiovibrio subtropicus]|uniref:GGDEF domain-containing protein n=1 Tax=Thaumasiovibrio subtropicus TaxID=1891207 RepID=UPI000B34BA3D|nr:GGDEF domain-containing protein [Thaumasiovibrio subtropicus]
MRNAIRHLGLVLLLLPVAALSYFLLTTLSIDFLPEFVADYLAHLCGIIFVIGAAIRLLIKPDTRPDFSAIYPTLTRLPTCTLVIRAKDGQLLYGNKTAREFLQVRKVGKNYFYPPSLDAQVFQQLLRHYDFERGFSFAKETFYLADQPPMNVVMSGEQIAFHGERAHLLFITPPYRSSTSSASKHTETQVFQSVLNSLAEMVHYTNNDGNVLGTNKSFDRFWQGRVEEGIMSDETEAGLGRRSSTNWTTAPDGTSRLLETSQTSLIDDNGGAFGTLFISHDVTDWHEMQESLRQEIEKRELTEQTLAQRTNLLDTLFAASQDPIGLYNEHGMYVGCNEAFIRWVAHGRDDLRGIRVADVLGEEAWQEQQAKDMEVMEEGKTIKDEEYVILDDGTPLWYEVMRSPYNDPLSDSKGVLLMARDVTERKMAEQQLADAIMDLQELSFVDSLTKVANRRSFDEQLTKLWHTHVREMKPLSLILCDIDYFKAFNDNYGHQQGDEALRQVAQVFKSVIRRESDVVARYGGEEFAFLLPNTDNLGAQVVSTSIHEALAEKGVVHGHSQVADVLTVSLGIATIVPTREQDYGELVALADKALYIAKDAGRNRTHNLIGSQDKVLEQ